MNRRKANNGRASSELEEALVGRLQELDWPKPTAEVKQRCLHDILDRMAEMKDEGAIDPNGSDELKETRRLDADGVRGQGHRHALTRRAAGFSHRQPLRLPERPARVATVLW